jgi:hypothetical protein
VQGRQIANTGASIKAASEKFETLDISHKEELARHTSRFLKTDNDILANGTQQGSRHHQHFLLLLTAINCLTLLASLDMMARATPGGPNTVLPEQD